ncbi:unnamed protein product [Nippostrongylus brasiliensis]|uniref:Aurora kinase n=1 Tax=Nippostrongylus brasiliensis TaxID=27835 RepID=A0A0N4XS82_NIPBR|nr:unnamed protein product [Nippostrongylus brasiliensis]
MKVTAVGPQMRAFTSRVRHFSTQQQFTHPAVVFVKDVQGRQNSLLGPADKQFPLPGDVCHKRLLQEQPVVQTESLTPQRGQNSFSVQELLSASTVAADQNYSAKVQESLDEEINPWFSGNLVF